MLSSRAQEARVLPFRGKQLIPAPQFMARTFQHSEYRKRPCCSSPCAQLSLALFPSTSMAAPYREIFLNPAFTAQLRPAIAAFGSTAILHAVSTTFPRICSPRYYASRSSLRNNSKRVRGLTAVAVVTILEQRVGRNLVAGAVVGGLYSTESERDSPQTPSRHSLV